MDVSEGRLTALWLPGDGDRPTQCRMQPMLAISGVLNHWQDGRYGSALNP